MSRSAVALRLALIATLCLALVLVGRWERDRAGRRAVEGIAAVRAAVGEPLAVGSAEAFLRADGLTCFLYTRGPRRYGVSLCYDDRGRLVEATDGRDGEPEVWTVRMDPGLAKDRVDPQRVQAVVDALSFRATLDAVWTTTLSNVMQVCLPQLRVLVNRPAYLGQEARVRSGVAKCREATAIIAGLGPTYLRPAPGVRRAVEVYVDLLRETVARLEALRAVLASGADRSDEINEIRLLHASLPGRLERAAAAMRQAIEEAKLLHGEG